MIVLVALAAILVLEWSSPSSVGNDWREVSYRGHTIYTVGSDSTGTILRAQSNGQNSALFRPLARQVRLQTLQWRWRVLRHPIGADPALRARDDRAAAVFVLVHRSFLPWRTRGLLYQWSTACARGRWTRSPYAADVKVLTLETSPAGPEWRNEQRNLEQDLRAAFGQVPKRIEAIGVLCDADNTRDRAMAEFGEIRCTVAP